MPTKDTYEFRIDGFTPLNLPMRRLADYMGELASLLGESAYVHFRALKRGSAVLVADVEPQATQRVRRRIHDARDPAGPDATRKHFERLNEMLRTDNAKGDLTVGSAKILTFPGRDQRVSERIGPFNEHTEVDGVLVRIGGTDDTAHAQIQDSEGTPWNCIVSRDLARQLSPHLYGGPLRVIGTGRWQRTELGEWEILSLRVNEFRELRGDELPAIVDRLRAIRGSGWERDNDPLATLARFRDTDEGVH